MIRALLACYPPSFRERYGAELAALVDDTGGGPRVCWDLAAGAAAAWLRPAFTGAPAERTRRRVQAGLAAVWVALCVATLAVPVVDRALLEPARRAGTGAVRGPLSVAWWVLAGGGTLAAGCALLMAARVLLPAVRAGRRDLVRPLAPAAVLLVLETLGAAGVWLARRAHPAVWPHPSAAFLIAVSAWLAGLAVLAALAAIGPPVTLYRARPPAHALRLPAALAAGVTVALALVALLATAAVVLGGRGTPALAGLTVLLLAAGGAALSTWRTMPALRTLYRR